MGALRVTDRLTATQDWVTASLLMDTVVTTGTSYKRPGLSFLGRLYSRLLGPIPAGYQKISRRVATVPIGIRRWHKWLAYSTATVGMSLAIVLQMTLPWTGLSLVSLVTPIETASIRGDPASAAVLVCWILVLTSVVILFITIWLHASVRSLLLSIALFEEQYFRTGAETWTLRQRIGSCVTLGVTAIVIPVFSVGTILSCMVVSRVVFMIVYRRSYARAGNNPYLATLDAARVHALYDEAILYALLSALIVGPLGIIFFYT